jgi:hypothetical protein
VLLAQLLRLAVVVAGVLGCGCRRCRRGGEEQEGVGDELHRQGGWLYCPVLFVCVCCVALRIEQAQGRGPVMRNEQRGVHWLPLVSDKYTERRGVM